MDGKTGVPILAEIETVFADFDPVVFNVDQSAFDAGQLNVVSRSAFDPECAQRFLGRRIIAFVQFIYTYVDLFSIKPSY
jgi:hypothetical protein